MRASSLVIHAAVGGSSPSGAPALGIATARSAALRVGLAIALIVLLPGNAWAFELLGDSIPCVDGCRTCHVGQDGGAGCAEPPCLDDFGRAFAAHGSGWDAALAGMDSDGDGFTNGEELGDPLGEWVLGARVDCRCTTDPGDVGSSPAYDADGDGYCCRGRDLDGDGTCTGPGEADGPFDCDDARSDVSPAAAETCGVWPFDGDCDGLFGEEDPDCEALLDRDGDGVCTVGIDEDGDGNCFESGFGATFGHDCDDMNPAVHFRAPEVCDNGIDDDCDGAVDLDDTQCWCLEDADCDDGDACTRDRCGDRGRCAHELVCEDASGQPMDAGVGVPGSPSGGCGCRASSRADTPGPFLVAAFFALLVLRRSRRAARRRARSKGDGSN